MKKKSSAFAHFTFLAFMVLMLEGCSPTINITETEYARAESFLQPNISKMVYHLEVQPHWLPDSTGFWHVTNTREGKRFLITRFEDRVTREVFNHEKLAAALNEELLQEVAADDLPFEEIRFVKKDVIAFGTGEDSWQYHLRTLKLEQQKQKEEASPEGVSPDGRYQAFIRDYNLFVRDLDTGIEQQLSTRGEYQLEYANTYGWYDKMKGEGGSRPENFFVQWAPDSRKLLTYLVDLRQAQKMYLLDFSVDSLYRPVLLSYYRGSPGDTTVVYYKPVIFDLDAETEVEVDVPAMPHFMGAGFTWSENSETLHTLYPHRGFKQADVLKIDATTGKTQVLLSETSDTSVEYSNLIMQRVGEDRLIFSSQRSGWHHLYLYDWNTGRLINQITTGEYVVKRLLHVDRENEKIYFLAAGREPGRNPYYDHLYQVAFDGSDLQLLTPEDAHHQVSISRCKQYFVDNFSKVDLPTHSKLRNLHNGEQVMNISEADVDDLLASGWQFPMPFKALARDGATDIYGVIYLPTEFKARRKYPIIDYTYTGPHTSATPRSFQQALFNIQNPMTAFGFAVVVVDGLGTAHRSKAFRDVSYQRMGFSLECHIAAIRQLAQRHSWMDTTRVGIYGHSAGGYDAARALLQYPDFYKVGVASAADHDHRMEKAWWPEMYMGYPVGDFYHEQSNVTNAANLQGHLLIAHGAIDENVNPSATYKLAENLIRAGKDFDMLILPGKDHNFGRSQGDYFTKVRWNYFIEHLLPATPLLHYQLKTVDPES